MNRPKTDPVLIQYILSLLDIPEINHSAAPILPDSQNTRTAENIIRFVDEMPGGFFIYHSDSEERLIYANPAVLRIFGCDTYEEFHQITHGSFKGMVHPDDLDAVEKSIREQIHSSQYDLDYVEYRIIRKDGEIRWIEDYGHFIHNESIGDIFYVFIGDATEKRNRLNQIQTQRLSVIEGLSSNYESILYIDLDADKIFPYRLNSRTEPLFKKKFQPLNFGWYITHYIETWVHPLDRERFRKAVSPEYIRQMLAEQKTYYINYRIVHQGENQYLQLRIADTDDDPQVSRIVIGSRRVDQEIQLEMDQKYLLESALNDANLAITAKNTFLSNMSHDMRTPLNAIFGFTSLARTHLHDPVTVETYLDKIEIASKHLLDLIEKVLEISWSESNDIQIIETGCNLCDIMQNVRQILLPQAQKKNLSLSVDVSGLSHSNVCTDPDKLQQLLLYLADNAITYTRSGGNVSITAIESEPMPNNYSVYRISVQDTGIGISSDFLEHIFEPFEREKNTTFSGIYGTGLGLTIAKNIAEKMGGTITVDSTEGSGSTFTVILRLRIQDQPPAPAFDTPTDIISQLKNCKILLVEDNEINSEMESEILHELGFLTEIASNGKIALDKIKQASPGDYALILMDIQMPVMNGWEATKAIRRLEDPRLSSIPIIALSADAFESNRRMSRECGMDAHLTKPLDVAQLLETITELIRRSPLV